MIDYREAIESDIDDIVELHKKCFPDFSLTKLGEYALRALYNNCLRRSGVTFIVASYDAEIIGFCVVDSENSSTLTFSFTKIEYLLLCYAFLCRFIRSPFQTLTWMRSLVSRQPRTIRSGAYLRSFAVQTKHRGRGVAANLLCKAEEIVIVNKENSVFLYTDAENNERAKHFYSKQGYGVVDEITRYGGRRLLIMEKQL